MILNRIVGSCLFSVSLITSSLANINTEDPPKQQFIKRYHSLPDGSHYLGKQNLNGLWFDNCYSIPNAANRFDDNNIIECGNDLGY